MVGFNAWIYGEVRAAPGRSSIPVSHTPHLTQAHRTTLPFQQCSSVVHDALNTLHYAHCSVNSAHYEASTMQNVLCRSARLWSQSLRRSATGRVRGRCMLLQWWSVHVFFVFVYLYLCTCICVLVFVYLHLWEWGTVGACCFSAVISHDDHLIPADHLVESIFSIAVNG